MDLKDRTRDFEEIKETLRFGFGREMAMESIEKGMRLIVRHCRLQRGTARYAQLLSFCDFLCFLFTLLPRFYRRWASIFTIFPRFYRRWVGIGKDIGDL